MVAATSTSSSSAALLSQSPSGVTASESVGSAGSASLLSGGETTGVAMGVAGIAVISTGTTVSANVSLNIGGTEWATKHLNTLFGKLIRFFVVDVESGGDGNEAEAEDSFEHYL